LFDTGALSACLVFYDRRVFPYGISVKKMVLEIAGLESRSGLIIADFTEKEHSPRRTLAS
jgi:hypothetical protein